MNRRLGVVVVVVVLVIATGLVRCTSHRARTPSGPPTAAPLTTPGRPLARTAAPPDPRSLTRGSIRGTVRDEAGAPIAGAKVCGDALSWQLPTAATRAPVCAATDDHGAYRLGNLIAADYAVHAGARRFQPATFFSPPGARVRFPLAAGEGRTGVDLVLRRGGVEVTGTVVDLAGGPVARAQVRVFTAAMGGGGPVDECDDQGRFSLWAAPGWISVEAKADGYAPGSAEARAPGKVEVVLTPASSLAGTVIDAATLQPVAGARVLVLAPDAPRAEDGNDITDEQGKFRVEPLSPARYIAVALDEHGYGRSEASALVGLAQQVEGIVVKLYPAHRVIARVEVAGSRDPLANCAGGLIDTMHGRRPSFHAEQDHYDADGVIPATYRVYLSCPGYHAHSDYDPVVVHDKDVEVTWQVDTGATVRGKVLTRAGTPVEGALVLAQSAGDPRRMRDAGGTARSLADGSYALTGLPAGSYQLVLQTEAGTAPRDGFAVDVPATGTVERDLVIDDAGALRGTVVDTAGAPVPGVTVRADPVTPAMYRLPAAVQTDASGSFALDPIPAGDYRVVAEAGWQQPLTSAGVAADAPRGERVSIPSGQTAQVRLVIESPNGRITGEVIDATGAPVPDAFVSSARESEAAGARASSVERTRDWWGEDRPVLTSTDGRFSLPHLAPGKYTLRAYRKGGGEVVAEHVAVATSVTLQIKPTGSIEGTAQEHGNPPSLLKLSLHDRATGLARTETYYRSGGHFLVSDLPAGHFDITVRGDVGEKTVTMDLGDGEARTGVAIALDALVNATGRLIDRATQKPVAGMRVIVVSMQGGVMLSTGADRDAPSDQAGRFTLRGAPTGSIRLAILPADAKHGAYDFVRIRRTIPDSGTDTVDIGDIPLLASRIRPGDPIGELGIHFVEPAAGADPDAREYKISWIDPAGPAARSGLQIGDVIVQVDGYDVTGEGAMQWPTLIAAPPGTKLALQTRSGTSATVVLAAP